MSENRVAPTDIKPVEKPIEFERPRFGIGIESVEVDNLIQASRARRDFKVTGQGLSVAVLDTGLRVCPKSLCV